MTSKVRDAVDMAEMGLMVGESREDVIAVIVERFGEEIAAEVARLI